jgi:hypothetical protein
VTTVLGLYENVAIKTATMIKTVTYKTSDNLSTTKAVTVFTLVVVFIKFLLGSRNKNPIHTPEVQKHLKAASDAVAKMREPAKKEMAKREKGINKAEVKLGFISSGKDRDGNKVVKATGKLTNKRMYGEEVDQIDERSL